MKWILDLLNGLWKKHRFWYWICFILYAILTLLIGVGISLLLTDRFFHLEHTGWSGLSSFSYGNFDKEHFGGYKYEKDYIHYNHCNATSFACSCMANRPFYRKRRIIS